MPFVLEVQFYSSPQIYTTAKKFYVSCKFVEVIVITASMVQIRLIQCLHVLDIHVIHPFLTHPTFIFGIHSHTLLLQFACISGIVELREDNLFC